jgi:colanic acid biosynthesis glycosyl transferase WcaI
MEPINAVIICQYYPPEQAPIGVMLRELSSDLVRAGHRVTVVTGFPNHPAGKIFPGFKRKLFAAERQDGVRVVRCWLYLSPKKTVFHRMLNFISFGITSFLAVLFFERPDLILSVSPPLSNGVTAMALKVLKQCHYIFNVQDIYPDAAVNAGVMKDSFLAGLFRKLELLIYKRARKVTVISEGFKQNLVKKGVSSGKVEIIYNWIDSSEIVPQPRDNDFSQKHGLNGKFVVLYSGTIGLISGAEIMLECSQSLKDHPDIVFLMVGEGAVKDRIRDAALKRGLDNIRMLPFQPREILSQVLSSADLAVVTLQKNRGQSSVPSKLLGYLAAARPVAASLDADSDTARFINRAGCGLCVPAEDAKALTETILALYQDPARRLKLGQKGRHFLLKHCDRKAATAKYRELMEKYA